MAHTIGALDSIVNGSSSPVTGTVVVAAGETVLVVMLSVVSATNRAGGALTYGSQTMTQAGSTQKAASSPECSAELWYLIDPVVGSATLTIPNTGSLNLGYLAARAKAPAGGKSKFSAAWGSNGTSTNPSCGSGALPSGGNIVFAVVASGATTWAPSARTGTLIADVDAGAAGAGTQYLIVNAPVPQGQEMAWTFGTSDDWGACAAAFSEVPAIAMNNYVMGVGDREL